MKNIKYYIVFITMLFCGANFAHASVIINEIQLNPIEERFIELYNSGSSSIDLTDWYIQRKTATGSTFSSFITKPEFEGKNIGAGEYFLISKSDMSNSDIVHPDFILTASNTIQIKNSDQELVDIVVLGDCDTCASNPTDGKSTQKMSNGSWMIASPTPRALNTESGGGSGEEEEENSNGSDTSSNKDEPLILKTTTKIISPKIVTAGVPFLLSSLTTTNKGETFAVGKYVWNFGDGMTSIVGKSSPFSYLYEYPGEYVLTLSYFDSYLTEVASATDRVTVKVISSGINISGVGTDSDPFIELENKSTYEIVLSDWKIIGGIHYFIIPEGTTILPNKKIKLSPKITGFVGQDIKSVAIKNPSQEIVATYPAETKKVIQKKISSVNRTKPITEVPLDNNLPNDSLLKDSQVINLNDLEANASGSGINIPNATYPLVGLLVVIGIGIVSFLLIKKKDNDYMEKEIMAEDIKIIE